MDNYALTALREYRYDSGRARYMARKYNASRVMANMTSPHQWSSNDGEDPPEWRVVEVFTDYEGDEPYGDFVETDSTSVPPTETASYEPGLWRKDLVSGVAEYLHNDHLGTLRATSPSGFTGGLGAQRAYTAFGEVVAGPTDRFGYVGAHGYQAHDGVPFLHVGARYYDPGSGRFLQRDPIGIRGGLNTYSYATNTPTTKIDPGGRFSVEEGIVGAIGGIVVGAAGGPKAAVIGGFSGFLVGGYEEGDAENAWNWTKEKVEDAWNWTERQIHDFITCIGEATRNWCDEDFGGCEPGQHNPFKGVPGHRW